jgi:phage tail protein X
MATETLTATQLDMPLDLLVWRRMLAPAPGLVEAALAGNPGLALMAIDLPVGTAVALDIPPPPAAQPPVRIVSLWD